MAELLQAVWQQVETFDWNTWKSEERDALHKAICRYGDEWDKVASAVSEKPRHEVVLAAIRLMLEEPDFLQHCGPELQPRLRKFLNEQRRRQQEDHNRHEEQQLLLQRYESYSVDQPNTQHHPQHSQQQTLDLQVAESSNLGSMQQLQQQLEQWQQQLLRHEQLHPLPPLPTQQQQQQLGKTGKRLSGSPEPDDDDDDMRDQFRPVKRQQLSPPTDLLMWPRPAQQQQQQYLELARGSPGAAAGPSPAALTPKAAAVLAEHQQVLAAARHHQAAAAAVQQQQMLLAAVAAQQQQQLRQQQMLHALLHGSDAAVVNAATNPTGLGRHLQLIQQQQQQHAGQHAEQQILQVMQEALKTLQQPYTSAAACNAAGLPTATSTSAAAPLLQQLAAGGFLTPGVASAVLSMPSSAAAGAQMAALVNPALFAAATGQGTSLGCPDAAFWAALSQQNAGAMCSLGGNAAAQPSPAAAAAAGNAGHVSGAARVAGPGAERERGPAQLLLTVQQQQQQQQQAMTAVSAAVENRMMISKAAELGLLFGSAAAACIAPASAAGDDNAADKIAAGRSGAQPQPANAAAHAVLEAQQQHQQQQILAQLQQSMQRRMTAAAAPPGVNASGLQAIMQQQQQQQQSSVQQQQFGHLLQSLALPGGAATATATNLPDYGSAVALLAAVQGLTTQPMPASAAAAAAAAVNSSAGVASAAATGGWNAAALAALAAAGTGAAQATPGFRDPVTNRQLLNSNVSPAVPAELLNPDVIAASLRDSSGAGSAETQTSRGHDIMDDVIPVQWQQQQQQQGRRQVVGRRSVPEGGCESEGSSES